MPSAGGARDPAASATPEPAPARVLGRNRLQSEHFDSSSSPPVWGPPPTHTNRRRTAGVGGAWAPIIRAFPGSANFTVCDAAIGDLAYPFASRKPALFLGSWATSSHRHQAHRRHPLLRARPRAVAAVLHRASSTSPRSGAARPSSSARAGSSRRVFSRRQRRRRRARRRSARAAAPRASCASTPTASARSIFEVEDIEKTFALLEERGGTPITDIQRFTGRRRHAAPVLDHHAVRRHHVPLPSSATATARCSRAVVPRTSRAAAQQPLRLPAHRPRHVELPDHEADAAVARARARLRAALGGRVPHQRRRRATRKTGSGLKSIVMWDPASGVKFANNEPFAPVLQELADQHLQRGATAATACSTSRSRSADIVSAVRGLRAQRRRRSCRRRARYYDMLPERLAKTRHRARSTRTSTMLRELEILVDGDQPPRVPAADLPEGVGRPLRRPEGRPVLLRDHPAQGRSRASAPATSARCSRASSASRRERGVDLMLDRMQVGDVAQQAPHPAARRRRRAALRGVLHARRLRRPVHDRLPPAPAAHAARRRRATHGWAVPRGRRRRARRSRKRHYRTQALPRRGGAADRRAHAAAASTTTSSSRRRVPDRRPIRSTSPTATPTSCIFIHEGGGTLRSLLGDVAFAQGDYVFVPRACCTGSSPTTAPQYWLSIECAAGFDLPAAVAQRGRPAAHGRAVLPPRLPAPAASRRRATRASASWSCKRGGAFHGFTLDDSPLDVVGWDGTVYPWAFPILNFQPRVGLVHLPPTWHGTFAARGALICSFVPRLVDFHPDAIPCPYPHSSSTATRSSSTATATSRRARASARAASRTTRPASPTARTPAPTRAASAPRRPTSWPSCSTPTQPLRRDRTPAGARRGPRTTTTSFAVADRASASLRLVLGPRAFHIPTAMSPARSGHRRSRRASRQRQVDRERRALAELALDLDLAAVELDEPARQRQAQARALGAHAARLRELLELAEQPRQVLARDADARVGDHRRPGARRRRARPTRTTPPRGVNLMAFEIRL